MSRFTTFAALKYYSRRLGIGEQISGTKVQAASSVRARTRAAIEHDTAARAIFHAFYFFHRFYSAHDHLSFQMSRIARYISFATNYAHPSCMPDFDASVIGAFGENIVYQRALIHLRGICAIDELFEGQR